jgi:hypothetical protein
MQKWAVLSHNGHGLGSGPGVLTPAVVNFLQFSPRS